MLPQYKEGQSKGQASRQQVTSAKGKGKTTKGSAKGGRIARKGKGKGKASQPQVKECGHDEDGYQDDSQEWNDWYTYEEDQGWGEQDFVEDDYYIEEPENQEESPADDKTEEQSDVDPKVFKLIWNQLEHIADDVKAESEVKPSLKTLTAANTESAGSINRVGVLIDGGASHNVYYSATIPEGAVERDIELAHGSKKGYVVNDDITFLDDSMSTEEGPKASIISLGRLVNYGAKLHWGKKVHF